MNDINKHVRVQESLLTPPERRVLRWLVRRTPAWLLPDHLTALGVAGAACVLLGFALSGRHPGWLWLANFGFVLNWYGDSMDGTVARYRKRERPRYGFFLDHWVDVVTEGMMFLGVGLSPYADFRIAACALMSYMALSILSYVYLIVSGEFKLSGGPIGPTEVRVIGMGITTGLYFFGAPVVTLPILGPLAGRLTWADLALAGLALMLIGMFLVIGRQLAAGLARLEP